MSNLPEEKGGKNHPLTGKQLQIVVGTSGALAALVVPVHSRGGRQLLTEPEGIQRVGRWQEREQDHDLSPQTQFPFASRLCGRLQPSILARRLNPEPTSAKLDQRAAYVALPSEAGLAGSRALVICGGNNQK